MTINQTVLNQLPIANRSGWIPAQLVGEDGAVLFEFLYNPQQKEFSRTVTNAEAPTALASVHNLQYLHTSGRTLALNSLLMETHSVGRSLKPLIEAIESLAVADVANGKYEPPTLYFSWGSDTFGPAKIDGVISWKESAWLGGEVAYLELSFSLKEIPPTIAASAATTPSVAIPTNEEVEAASRTSAAVQVISNDLLALATEAPLPVQLTQRQQAEGLRLAEDWLTSNISRVATPIRQAYRGNQYELTTSANGVIQFTSRGAILGSIGIYDGESFEAAS